jgi:separase
VKPARGTAKSKSKGKAAEAEEEEGSGAKQQSGEVAPVVLLVESTLTGLPWESLPSLRQQRMFRLPSLTALKLRVLPAAAVPPAPPAAKARGKKKKKEEEEEEEPCCTLSPPVVKADAAFYLLNPSGDLTHTQHSFQSWFAAQPGWHGHVGATDVPPPASLLHALDASQLFVYFGHGGGEAFVPAKSVWARDHCAAALLMGCSSGRLGSTGHYEAPGVALAYLAADAPLVIANLWDVTDRDIDRFSSAVLQRWLHSAPQVRAALRSTFAALAGEVSPSVCGCGLCCRRLSCGTHSAPSVTWCMR